MRKNASCRNKSVVFMKKHKTKKRSSEKIVATIFSVIAIFLVLAVLCVGVAVMFARRQINFESDKIMFEAARGDKTTRFYYDARTEGKSKKECGFLNTNAKELGEYLPSEYTQLKQSKRYKWCDSDSIPAHLKNAFVAIEDHRFYSHDGVDFLRTAYAAVNYVLKFKDRFGGSTITQQLVKNITSDNGYNAGRKLREVMRALEIEKRYSKEEILELYLNIVPMPCNCIGVASASEYFFGKSPADLTVAEAASLAASACSPSKYDPSRHPENNVGRRNLVLSQMLRYGFISQEEYESGCAESISLARASEDEGNAINSWYTDTVVEDVIDDLCVRLKYSREAATKLVYSGGLSIYTFMDPRVQEEIDLYFSDESNFGGTDAPEYAITIMDSKSGNLLGIYGGRGKKKGNRLLNYASDVKRAPGSSIKPISVYAPALEEKLINYATVIDDTPLTFIEKEGELRAWPMNYPDVYSGLTDIKTAIALSKNTVALKIMRELGVERSFSYLKNKFGISSIVRRDYDANGKMLTDFTDAALALGQLSHGITLRELCAAYTPFSSGSGIFSESRSYYLVTDSKGNVILENKPHTVRAISRENSYIMTKLLESTVSFGTASDMKLKSVVDAAGKTGTSNYDLNRNFICYTPYLLCGVWCGYPTPREMNSSYTSPTEICDEIMLRLHEYKIPIGSEPIGFEMPSSVLSKNFCVDSGMLVGELCECDSRKNRVSRGYFTADNIPETKCERHICFYRHIDRGGVVSEKQFEGFDEITKSQFEKTSLVLVEDRSFPKQIYVTDAQYVCRRTSEEQPESSEHNPHLPYFAATLPEGEYVGISPSANRTQYNSAFDYEGDEDYEDDFSFDPREDTKGNEWDYRSFFDKWRRFFKIS